MVIESRKINHYCLLYMMKTYSCNISYFNIVLYIYMLCYLLPYNLLAPYCFTVAIIFYNVQYFILLSGCQPWFLGVLLTMVHITNTSSRVTGITNPIQLQIIYLYMHHDVYIAPYIMRLWVFYIHYFLLIMGEYPQGKYI